MEGDVLGSGGAHDARSLHALKTPGGTLMTSVAAVAVVAAAFAAAVDGGERLHPQTVDRVTLTLGVISKALFLGAGIVQLSRWRIASEMRSLYWGTALVVLGGFALPLSSLAAVIAGDDRLALLPALTAADITLVAVVLIALGLRNSPPPTEDLAATPILLMAGVTVTSVFGLLTALHFAAPTLMHTEHAAAALPRGIALSFAWLAPAVMAARHSRADSATGAAPLLGCMAVAELLRAVGAAHSGAWTLLSAGLVLCVSASASHRAVADLNAATQAGREALASTKSALDTAHVVADAEHDRQEELEHDARNSLAGLRAALLTIDRYGTRLDEGTLDRLRQAALSEVHHLEHLIIHDRDEPLVDFQLDAVLARVVDIRRATGTVIALTSEPATVRGRPADLCTALSNLLVNADEHGAGPITVTALRIGDHMEVNVADNGPGIPSTHLADVFGRGVKGPTSNGCGFGLGVARELLRRQRGDLELRSHTNGCVFTVTLPLARVGAAASEMLPAQRAQFVRATPGPARQAEETGI